MLTGSTSPLKDLESLLQWLELPETKEVLGKLQELAEPARRLALAPPQTYRITLTDFAPAEQRVYQREAMPDGQTAEAMRQQFIGNYKGLIELQQILTAREEELREIIKKQENGQPR